MRNPKFQITMKEELLKLVDAYATQNNISRSSAISFMISNYAKQTLPWFKEEIDKWEK